MKRIILLSLAAALLLTLAACATGSAAPALPEEVPQTVTEETPAPEPTPEEEPEDEQTTPTEEAEPVTEQPERGTITDPDTGLEYSDSTLILSLDPDMTEDTFAALLEKYGLHTVYDYDNFTMAAVGTEKPCTADELDRLIASLSEEEGVLGVEKDNVIRLIDPILADG